MVLDANKAVKKVLALFSGLILAFYDLCSQDAICYHMRGGHVRSILDTCTVCQIGRLLPHSRPCFAPSTLGRLEPIGPWPCAADRRPYSPVLDFLACNVCGLRY